MARRNRHNAGVTDMFIGINSSFEGNIQSEACVRIEGAFQGKIQCTGDVIIGEQGRAVSEINCRNIIIAGTVKGNVNTSELATITAKGRMLGILTTPKISIVDGGILQGHCRMVDKDGKLLSYDQENAELTDSGDGASDGKPDNKAG